jgi:hypothetical protein
VSPNIPRKHVTSRERLGVKVVRMVELATRADEVLAALAS